MSAEASFWFAEPCKAEMAISMGAPLILGALNCLPIKVRCIYQQYVLT
jgi:hypothetical protein